jgi:hypothetical protein
VKALLALLVLLVLLAVGADVGARYYAEQKVAAALRQEQGLARDPHVSINGFPFLTQVAAGSYTQVTITATGYDAPHLGPIDVSATLRDVALPTSQVLSGHIGTVTVGRIDSVIRIPASTLGPQLGVPDLTLSAGSTGSSSAQLVGTVSIAGVLSQVVSLQADLSIVDGNLVVVATDAAAGAPGTHQTRLPTLVQPLLLHQISRTIKLTQQPLGIIATGVTIEGSDLVLTGSSAHATITRTHT